jgi:hypothetical protein
MTCPGTDGTGTSRPEQFIPFRPDLTAQPILPGQETLLQSLQTGKFCRIVVVAGVSVVQCDVDTPAEATPVVYTGTGAGRSLPCGRGGGEARPGGC